VLSVIIPSRNEKFLNKTIKCALHAAVGDVEVLVLLDGAPPAKPIPNWRNVRVIEEHTPGGIGDATWQLANEAQGEFIMKLDAHCLLAEGYDEILKAHCDYKDLLVPARYQLKDDGWKRGYGPIHYLFLTYPWMQEPQFGAGMHGKKWQGDSGLAKRAVGQQYFWPERAWKDKYPLDDIMAFQGSCWFMHRERFLELDGVDKRCWLWGESLNIGLKVFMSGGQMKRDKSTWYAHLHKGRKHGRGYYIQKRKMQAINLWSADYWMNDRWDHPLKERGIKEFVEHFWPLPGWPDDWDDPKYQEAFEYPGLTKEQQCALIKSLEE